jgi:hypothetical protein
LCEEVPRQNAAESLKIPESGSVIPREGVERYFALKCPNSIPYHHTKVIPREGVERSLELPAHALYCSMLVIPREGVESRSEKIHAWYIW